MLSHFLLTIYQKAAAAAARRTKRKLVTDAETELKGQYIRQRLEPSGADDVTRTPFEEYPTTLEFDRPVIEMEIYLGRIFFF